MRLAVTTICCSESRYKTAMLLREVQYARPPSVQEAIELLASDPNARPLAGGQTLINVMKARIASPEVLVDLNGLDELRAIELGSDGTLELGAMVTYSELMASAECRARPILGEVAEQIADFQVRNRGTIGGNVCANDPTNHFPPLLVALGATMTIAGGDGERTVPAEDFFVGVYLTAAGPGELLTKVTVPPAEGAGDGFASVTIGRDGTGIVNVAASANGDVRVAVGCVAAVPVLVRAPSGDDDAVREAVRAAELDPPSDVHASADYRRHLAEVLAARAVRQASGRRRS
jgi:carbon-monoxide dehydrogenase medium subunit